MNYRIELRDAAGPKLVVADTAAEEGTDLVLRRRDGEDVRFPLAEVVTWGPVPTQGTQPNLWQRD